MPAPGDAGYTPAQLQYAQVIAARGRARGASPEDIQVALMVALAESDLQNYANATVPESLGIPHDAIGSDHASVGLFQQQVGIWGSARDLMDPGVSADKFFAALEKVPAGAPPWVRAQAVQKSAFPDGRNYQARAGDAAALAQAVTGDPGGDFSGGVAGTFPLDWATGLNKLGGTLRDPEFWRRAGLFILGGVLVLIALWHALGGTQAAADAAKLAGKVLL